MTVAINPVHRQFSNVPGSQFYSSNVHSVTVEGTDVVVTHHSNPDKAYLYSANESYAEWLSDLLSNDAQLSQVSIGKTINDAKRTEELSLVTIW